MMTPTENLGYDFEMRTKTIRDWLHRKTVNSDILVRELRYWADIFDSEQVTVGLPPKSRASAPKNRDNLWTVTMSVFAFDRTEWTVAGGNSVGGIHALAQGQAESMKEAMVKAREVIANEWIKGDHDDI